jgi:hypothetical protein
MDTSMGARNICVEFADVTRIRRESGTYLTQISLVPIVLHLRISLHVISSVDGMFIL